MMKLTVLNWYVSCLGCLAVLKIKLMKVGKVVSVKERDTVIIKEETIRVG